MTDDPDVRNAINGNVEGNAAQVGRDVYGGINYFGPKPDEPLIPRQLPATPPNFIGRSTQLSGLTALADQSCAPIVVSHPAKGIGKTTLVARWARTQEERFPDGFLYFNLRGSEWPGVARRWEDVVRDVLHVFGVNSTAHSSDAQLGQYRTVLDSKKALLVLDDARDAEQVRPLLLSGTGSLVVVTSRNQLAELIGHGARWLPIDQLSREDAGALLTGSLGADRVEPAAVARLVELSFGVPGALGVLAAAAGTAPAASIASELEASPDVAATRDPVTRAEAIHRWAHGRSAPQRPWRPSTMEVPWLRDRRVFIGVAVALCAAVAGVSSGVLPAAGPLGILYFLLRFALLLGGLALMERAEPRGTLAVGAVAGSTVYFLVDALVSVFNSARALVWLELLAVAAFTTLLCLQRNPLRHRPHRLRQVPLGSRPVAFALLGGVTAWLILLFVSISYEDAYGYTVGFTLIGAAGALGALLPLLAIGGVCVVLALYELTESQRLFAGAAIGAYLVPELLLLLGSLALGDRFAYFGNAVWGSIQIAWFTIAQAVVAVAITAGTLVLVRGKRA